MMETRSFSRSYPTTDLLLLLRLGGPDNRSTSARVECNGTMPRHPLACMTKLRARIRDRPPEVLSNIFTPRLHRKERLTLQITREHKPRPLEGALGASPVHLVVMRALPPISSEVLARPPEGSASSKCTVVFSVTLPTGPPRQPPASGNPRLDDSLATSTVGTPLRFRSLRSCNKPRGV